MKKIISFLMASALLLGAFLGVTSCSGDLHDAEAVSPDLEAGGPIGDFIRLGMEIKLLRGVKLMEILIN